MFETYQMLGREHQADLEREAQRVALARVVRRRRSYRLVLRSLRPRLAARPARIPTLASTTERSRKT
jgi:hypothetical protein